MIRSRLPGAALSEVIEGWMGFCSVSVRFQNGLSLLVSTDADVPEVLFEIIRFAGPDDAQQFPFEVRAGLGSFYCDKLTSQGAVALLTWYNDEDASSAVVGVAADH